MLRLRGLRRCAPMDPSLTCGPCSGWVRAAPAWGATRRAPTLPEHLINTPPECLRNIPSCGRLPRTIILRSGVWRRYAPGWHLWVRNSGTFEWDSLAPLGEIWWHLWMSFAGTFGGIEQSPPQYHPVHYARCHDTSHTTHHSLPSSHQKRRQVTP